MKNILITGATGFLGSHFSKHYIDKGYSVIGIGTKPENEISFDGLSKYEQLILPDDKLYDLIEEYKPDLCLHCAGSSSVGLSIENPQNDFDMNVPVTFHLLEGLKQFLPDCKTIFISSAAVYGNPEYLPIDENHPTKPISPYGFHKMICENICYEYSKLHNLNINIIRIFSAYGPELRKQILWDIYNKVNTDDQIILSGTGQETRDFIYIKDIISAIDLVIKSTNNNFEIFNIASGKETTIHELAEIMVNELGLDIQLKFNGKIRYGDPMKWKADISKISALGFKSKFNINEGIREYCQWIKRDLNGIK